MSEFHEAMVEAYTDILESNENVLEWLCTAHAAEVYPNLYELLHRYRNSLWKRLIQLHEYSRGVMQKAGMITWCSYHGVFEVPAARTALMSYGGGDSATWGKVLWQFGTMGLTRKHVPQTDQRFNTQGHIISAERAKQRGRKHSATWCGIPVYTPELLEYAEAIAKTAADVRGKDGLRDAVGSEAANDIANTARGEHPETTLRRRLLLAALERQLKAYGCAYDRDIVAEARQNYEDTSEWWRMQPTWLEYRPEAMRLLDLKRGRPTREEKERFVLDDDAWIIRPVR